MDTNVRIIKTHFILASVPFFICLVSAVKESLLLFIIANITVFLYLWIIPACKHNENIWGFVIYSFALIPANIRLCHYITYDVSENPAYNIINRIVYFVVFYTLLFSFEQLVAGSLIKLIFRYNKLSGRK